MNDTVKDCNRIVGLKIYKKICENKKSRGRILKEITGELIIYVCERVSGGRVRFPKKLEKGKERSAPAHTHARTHRYAFAYAYNNAFEHL